jgi:hypothetical protein
MNTNTANDQHIIDDIITSAINIPNHVYTLIYNIYNHSIITSNNYKLKNHTTTTVAATTTSTTTTDPAQTTATDNSFDATNATVSVTTTNENLFHNNYIQLLYECDNIIKMNDNPDNNNNEKFEKIILSYENYIIECYYYSTTYIIIRKINKK